MSFSSRALGAIGFIASFGAVSCADDDDDDGAITQPGAPSGSATTSGGATGGGTTGGGGTGATTGGGTAGSDSTGDGTTSGGAVVGDMPDEVRALDGDTGGGTTGGGAAGPGGVVGVESVPPDTAGEVPPGTGGTPTVGAGGASGGGAGAAGAAAAIAGLSDGQIVFVADTLNAGEIEQARAALPQLTDEGARAFAQRMIDEHEPASEALLDVADEQDITPELSDVATALRDESDAIIAQLLEAERNAADALYIETQITAHGEALGLLEALIAAADDESLQSQLTSLRTSVQSHLEQATELQSNAL